ncbi:MAG: hypothetical protein KZQ58_08605, partial [gamma proteobacterium symbiont of Bathyaustriella thionipta]|nr:hypothetical protein [gamma proteobacterium symbiont of Bathyaustriella thionipta]
CNIIRAHFALAQSQLILAVEQLVCGLSIQYCQFGAAASLYGFRGGAAYVVEGVGEQVNRSTHKVEGWQ